MFDAAALVLEEIAPDDKNRNEVLGARVILNMAAKKWEMAEALVRAQAIHPKVCGPSVSVTKTTCRLSAKSELPQECQNPTQSGVGGCRFSA